MMARLSILLACLALGGSAGLEWEQGAPLPVPRSEVAASTLGREVVIAGGFLGDGRARSASIPTRRPATAGAGFPICLSR
jgi:hypothetical protein